MRVVSSNMYDDYDDEEDEDIKSHDNYLRREHNCCP